KAIAKDESSQPFGEWAAAAEVPWKYHVVNDEALLTIGDLSFPCMSLQDLVATEERVRPKADLYWFAPHVDRKSSYPRGRFTASSLGRRADVEAGGLVELGRAIAVPHNETWDKVGDGMHQILGVGCRRKMSRDDAQGILGSRGLNSLIKAEDTLEILSRLQNHAWTQWPGATLHPEYPIMYSNEKSQRTLGWIDLLVETDAGYVIIDHKSYVGSDLEEKALSYSGQLAFYSEAVELATGKPVLGCWVHFMFAGKMVELRLLQSKKLGVA
ncbi:MAG: hypothetical protein EOP10_35135, partial [Proteobacteria bacterium]